MSLFVGRRGKESVWFPNEEFEFSSIYWRPLFRSQSLVEPSLSEVELNFHRLLGGQFNCVISILDSLHANLQRFSR